MAISVGDAVLKLGVDTKGFDRSLQKSQRQVKTTMQKMQKSLMVAGVAFTAVGIAGLKLADSARKMNAQLGVTALNLGVSAKEMRNLALETTNVTFPLNEVLDTFDLLARTGIKNQQVLKDLATFFDTLGDAIGLTASVVTTKMIPAMFTFNLTAEEMAEKGDALTWLFRNTIVSMDAFNAMIGYVSPEMVAMGFTMEDMIKIMAHLEDQGYAGELMMRKWRTATGEATRENKSIYDVLGITTEQMKPYEEALKGITGLTKKYADAANEQYGIMDKLKQKWAELTLQYGSFLQPLEPILATMTALGPVMLLFSTVVLPSLTFATAAHTVALVARNIAFAVMHPLLAAHIVLVRAVTLAQWLWNAAMIANPIGLLIAGIAILATGITLLVKNWGSAGIAMRRTVNDIKNFFKTAFEAIGNFIMTPVRNVLALVQALMNLWSMLMRFMGIGGGGGRPSESEEERRDRAAVIAAGEIERETRTGGIRDRAAVIAAGEIERETRSFATGGIITQPTLAMLGEAGPEAVIPLRGKSPIVQNVIHVYLDAREVTGTVLDHMTDEVSLKGGF